MKNIQLSFDVDFQSIGDQEYIKCDIQLYNEDGLNESNME